MATVKFIVGRSGVHVSASTPITLNIVLFLPQSLFYANIGPAHEKLSNLFPSTSFPVHLNSRRYTLEDTERIAA